MRAIVTDGLWRKSLSAIRSLGKAGFKVAVMGDTPFTTGFWSRFASKRVLAPTAKDDPAAFGEVLLRELQKNPGTVILPMEDASLVWISENAARIQKISRFLIPPSGSLRIAHDKAETIRTARDIGLTVPQTWYPQKADEFAHLATKMASELKPGEFVVKPRSGTGSAGVAYGVTKSGWEAHWDRFGPMVIQERIPAEGRGQGVSVLMDQDGECVAAFAHERIQQYPNSGGPSTDRQSILAPELVEMSVQLLKHLRWRGIAMVEWKADPRDGKPKLMEINPRFWGSLELAVRAGVDFPTLYARAALGEKLGAPPSYPAGVRCRWLIPGEILRYATQPWGQRESVFKFLKGLPGNAEEWDKRDIPGAIATVICTGALAANPAYWKYVKRL